MKPEHDWNGLLYHHCIPIDACQPKIIEPFEHPEEEDIDDPLYIAYRWLKTELGFYPLFLAVGNTEANIRITGYHEQWLKKEPGKNKIDNRALFSFKELPPGAIFNDWNYWGNVVVNNGYKNFQLSDYERRRFFKTSWKTSRWLNAASIDPFKVQLVVPQLDLAAADLISVRNIKTKTELQKRGFTQPIEVRRILVRD